jgi:hypothetical protein
MFLALALMSLPVFNNSTVAAKPAFSTPTITCVDPSGTDYIDIQVCAGATGAPAGFSIQWETLADYNTYGWPADSSCPLDVNGNQTCGDSFCKASFSGNASFSNYNLAAFACVTVRIGDLLLDNGASTDCPNRLLCGTEYVFRAFAHANSAKNRSAFTANLICSTLDCNPGCDPCVKSFGYYAQHCEVISGLTGGAGLTVGCQTYTDAQLCDILHATPAGGNALVSLAHQVINARLNLLCPGVSQAYIDAVSTNLASADALMCTTGAVPPVGSGSLTGAQAGASILALDTTRAQFECSDE